MRRGYATVDSSFWMRGTGKQLRGDVEAQIIALYLMSSPSSTMTGIYYLPLATLAYETGIPSEGASKALRRLSEVGFVEVDEETDFVFVVNLAKHQVGKTLAPKDNNRIAVVRQLRELDGHPLVESFLNKYRDLYGLSEEFPRAETIAPSKPLKPPFEGASKPENREQGSESRDQRTGIRESAARSSRTHAQEPPRSPSEAPPRRFDQNDLTAVVSAELREAKAGSYPADIPLGTHASEAIAAARYFVAEGERLGRPPNELCRESVRDFIASPFAVEQRRSKGSLSMTQWFREPSRNAPWARGDRPVGAARGNAPSTHEEFEREAAEEAREAAARAVMGAVA